MDSPRLNLLDEALIRIRDSDGLLQRLSLPELFVALAADAVRDYPALRPHQRHPWHALLVQLAALALQEAGETKLWTNAGDWRTALLALTPEHPDGCAFSLIAPHDKPAFLQASVLGGKLDGWKSIPTPDALDMLVTSKNHDLKGERMRHAEADDWLYALVSLQTQEGVQGNGKLGISRMNSGYGNRPAVGISPPGMEGNRWRRDIKSALEARSQTASDFGLRESGGVSLLWTLGWDGSNSLQFAELDPLYVEICRRVRLACVGNFGIQAYDSTSKAKRINVGEDQKGKTGDPWVPINLEESKALNLPAAGFSYSLCVDILWGGKYKRSVSQSLRSDDAQIGNSLLARGIVRGNGKTEGYHERRIPLSKKVVGFLRSGQTDRLAVIAEARVKAIAIMRGSVLRTALFYLLEAGTEKIDFDRRTAKQQIEPFVRAFEHAEDARFFDDLNREIEAEDANVERMDWLTALASRAEVVLRSAFVIGPQCGERRYRARSRALSYFHGALGSDKNFPALAQYLRSHPAAEEAVS